MTTRIKHGESIIRLQELLAPLQQTEQIYIHFKVPHIKGPQNNHLFSPAANEMNWQGTKESISF